MDFTEDILRKLRFPVAPSKVYYVNAQGLLEENKNYKAIIRTDTDKAISIMSKNYKIVNNSELVDNLLEAMEELNIRYYAGRDSYVQNNRMRLHLIFPDIYVDNGIGEEIAMSSYLHNSYDGSEGVRFLLGGIRYACSNGMVFGKVLEKFYHKHTKGFNVEKFKIIIESGIESIPSIKRRIEEMKNSKVESKIFSELKHVLGKKLAEEIEVQYNLSAIKNLWTLYNLVTYILSNVVVNHRIRAMKQIAISNVFKL